MKLQQIQEEMSRYNGEVAYGSECNAWQDFVEDTFQNYKTTPWHDTAKEIECSKEFGDYWIGVTNGKGDDYDSNGSNNEA